MPDIIAIALILVIGVPLALAIYFGVAFVKSAWQAKRLLAQQRKR